ncbi:hypothetical protein ACFU99_05400 [Streptomyces sp. NPDC057654]|uniref:hypothetical protein n=1 Tax=Streptomyces sp. NPDC057654 TaxID=3346196 RepID=UPI0036AE282D
MLDRVLEVLAAAGGAAVAAAVGAGAWAVMRRAVARWAGRGDARREPAELDRLDETAAALRDTGPDTDTDTYPDTYADTDPEERRQARHAPSGDVRAGSGGLAVGGDVAIHAEGGGIAAGIVQGGARLGRPRVPAPRLG